MQNNSDFLRDSNRLFQSLQSAKWIGSNQHLNRNSNRSGIKQGVYVIDELDRISIHFQNLVTKVQTFGNSVVTSRLPAYDPKIYL